MAGSAAGQVPRLAAARFLAARRGAPAGASSAHYAITRRGHYAREPDFAGFVNAALVDGWKLVADEYAVPPKTGETPQQRMQAREQGQARNLVERIFAKDKNAKVLIHVGYGHLYRETPDMALVVMGGYVCSNRC